MLRADLSIEEDWVERINLTRNYVLHAKQAGREGSPLRPSRLSATLAVAEPLSRDLRSTVLTAIGFPTTPFTRIGLEADASIELKSATVYALDGARRP